MPTYEYECKSCGHTFEAFQSMSDAPLRECPKCGKEIRRLINGGGGIIFKGSGFYVTDKNKASSKTASSKPEQKSAKPAESSGTAAGSAGTATGTAGSAGCASCPAAAASGGPTGSAGSCPASEKAAG